MTPIADGRGGSAIEARREAGFFIVVVYTERRGGVDEFSTHCRNC
jgi:hypothetical protein